MMDDVIYRQEAIDNMAMVIWGYPNEIYPLLNDMDMALQLAKDGLMGVPTAQQWIPCSERLPDQNGKYLVVGRQKAINILKFDGGRWYGKWGVVAWMPLPSPYREEVSD